MDCMTKDKSYTSDELSQTRYFELFGKKGTRIDLKCRPGVGKWNKGISAVAYPQGN